MIGNKTEFLTGLKTLIGEDTSDTAIAVLEYANTIDTNSETQINELNEKITNLNGQIETLQKEKNELDESWRKRYKDTFYNPPTKNDNSGQQNERKKAAQNYSDLFIEKE